MSTLTEELRVSENNNHENDEGKTVAQSLEEELAAVEQSVAQTKSEGSENGDKNQIDTVTVEAYEALQAKLSAAIKRADEQWDIAVRSKAEVENVRRRAEKDIEKTHKYGLDKLIGELLGVVDSLEHGLLNIDSANEASIPMREGMELTLKLLLDALAKFGLELLDPQGEAFNPAMHEAITMQASAEAAAGTILQVIQKGYKLHDRLLRPARVIVAKADSSKVDENA